MKKHLITATFAVAIAAMAGYNTYLSHVEDGMSDMVLENVEALADDTENGSLNGNTTWQEGEKTIVTETFTTTTPGYTWDAELNVWLLNGSVVLTSPPDTKKEITTVKLKCCREKGDLKVCSYEAC